jgi:hypothetical protein
VVRVTHFEGQSASTRKPYALCMVRAWSRIARKFTDCGIPLLTELRKLGPNDVQMRNLWSKSDFVPGTYLWFSLSVVYLFPPSCVSKLADFHNLVWKIELSMLQFWIQFVRHLSDLYFNIFSSILCGFLTFPLLDFVGICILYAHLYSHYWSVYQRNFRPPVCPVLFFVLKDSSWGKIVNRNKRQVIDFQKLSIYKVGPVLGNGFGIGGCMYSGDWITHTTTPSGSSR